MESHNSTTRTYTALTCELIVANDRQQSSGLPPSVKSPQRQTYPQPVDFTLHLDDPDRGELDRITIAGQFHQLDRLQQVVNKYITELIAKFPLPIMNNTTSDQSRSTTTDLDRHKSNPKIDAENSISSKLYPNNDSQSTKSGLMNNLPGLRNNLAQSNSGDEPNPQSNSVSSSGVSKLFGGWNKRNNDKKAQSSAAKQQHTPLDAASSVKFGFGKRELDNLAGSQPEIEVSPTTPYLTSNDRSLDRQLHLGDLATETTGDVVTLSPIQLFDLSTVLDEYAADATTPSTAKTPSVTLSHANIPGHDDRSRYVDPATVSLARLPNLPRNSGGLSQTSEVFNRTRRSSSRSQFSFMSVVPWAAAAAVAVGVPLLLLDSKPNPLKDATSKVKMPDFEGVKKTVTAAMSPAVVDPEPTTSEANPNLPKPWQEQAVQPPQTGVLPKNQGTGLPQTPTNSIATNPQPTQTSGKIGIAPLPTELVGKPGKDLPTGIPGDNTKPNITSVMSHNGSQSEIPSNPLNSTQIGTGGTPPKLAPAKLGGKISTSIPSKITRLPNSNSPEPQAAPVLGSMTKPILSPFDLAGMGINQSTPSQVPLTPVQVDSPTTKPASANKITKQKVKPQVAAKTTQPKPAKSIGVGVVRQPLFEQSAPIPANPNLIDPIQPQTSVTNTEFQNLPPADPATTATNNGTWPGDSIDSPSLQETKRYFQAKWKGNNNQANALQYVVQINGKNGLVQSVASQGEAAKTYLQKSKLVKVGQKLVSPASTGNIDQKIRVILQPDGNVDTFVEPQV